jgi:hypothetical protein
MRWAPLCAAVAGTAVGSGLLRGYPMVAAGLMWVSRSGVTLLLALARGGCRLAWLPGRVCGGCGRRLRDERWFREITEKAIRRGVFASVRDLIAAIEAYLDTHNDNPKPFVWTATAEDILAKVERGRVALQQAAS